HKVTLLFSRTNVLFRNKVPLMILNGTPCLQATQTFLTIASCLTKTPIHMAKQNGLLKFRGTIDDLNFYQSKDGQLVRKKTSIDAARIASDPSFIRTRENGAEFGAAGKAGKVLRDALKPMM